MATKSNSINLGKKIVRKIGADVLPVEALNSLKVADKTANLDSQNIVADGSSQGFSTDRHVHFARNPKNPKRTWKPNLKLKRIFNYIHDHEIEPKVTVYTVKSIERQGGTSRYTVKTPYYKSETDLGLLWKGKAEGKYIEFWNKEVGYFTPQEEANISKALQNLKH